MYYITQLSIPLAVKFRQKPETIKNLIGRRE
jgi:hypothetical protein